VENLNNIKRIFMSEERINITKYQELSKRTFPDLGDKDKNIFHVTLGVQTEIGVVLDIVKKHIAYGKELDLVHINEELGDLCFYAVNGATLEEITLPEEVESKTYSTIEQACYALTDIPLLYTFEDIMVTVQSVYYYFNEVGSFEDCLQKNVDKLLLRYPEGFTTEKATNRDLEAERKLLES
jgi:NTP pyrophosphatase (non-canonical NTP hydrolase)